MTHKELCKKYYPYAKCIHNRQRNSWAIFMLCERLTPDEDTRFEAWSKLAFILEAQIAKLKENGSFNDFTTN
jgi:hypothetical protein